MRKIYGIGETLLDIIFRDDQPKAAKPGGSVLNSIVSMGRMKLPVYLISEYGNDLAGSLIDNFLQDNGVDTSYIHRFGEGKTALAIAFLDERNDAKYDFYKHYPANRLNIGFPAISRNDIVQCGSFYAIWPEVREKFDKFIRASRENGAFILYDPNFRKAHDIKELRPSIIANMKNAVIVRGSDEDFGNIFDAHGPDEAWQEVSKYCSCMVYTANTRGVYVRTSSFSGTFPVKKIEPVSTIGAGDNFNAGMLTSIYRNGIGKDDLNNLGEKEWSDIIGTAVEFATHVCMSYDNYISEEFARNYISRTDS